jgi:hypothetical protein
MPNKTLKDMSQDELKDLRSKLQSQIQAKGPQATEKEQKLLDIVHKMLDDTVATANTNKQHSVLGSHAQADMSKGQYRSLNDKFEDGSTEIWFVKPGYKKLYSQGISHMRADGVNPPNPQDLEQTHIHLGNVADTNLKRIFAMMQGDEWSPNGEARELIRGKHLDHTSMIPGDVIVTPDRAVMVDRNGAFYDIGTEKPVHEDLDFSAIIEGRMDFSVASEILSEDEMIDEFYKDAPNPEGYKEGQTVFCGSQSGAFIRTYRDDETGTLMAAVKSSRGGVTAFPYDKIATKKPSMFNRMSSYMMGEGLQHGKKVYYQGKSGKIVDYVRGDKTHIVVELPNGQMDSFPVAGCSYTPVAENIADAGSAGAVNADGAVVEAPDIKMIKRYYFMTRGTPDTEKPKFGLREDNNGEWYLPRYNTSGAGFDRNFTTCVRSFGEPYKVVNV